MGDQLGARVMCHSGSAYGERPLAFDWEGQRLDVEAVVAQWRAPGERVFVVSADQWRFELIYNEAQDAWRIKAL